MTRITRIVVAAIPGLVLAGVGMCCEWIAERTSRGCYRLSNWING